MKLVSLQNISVDYDGYVALKDANLEIYDDDFLGIIGPNGGGKTTLVKTIVGALPYSGKIEFAKELYDGKRRLIGYMPQQTRFDKTFPISVIEVVMSGLQSEKGFLSRYKAQDRQRAYQLLEVAGIESLSDKQIGEISGGELQRTLLCLSLIHI